MSRNSLFILILWMSAASACADGDKGTEDASTDEQGDCPAGMIFCDGACVDHMADRNNCGRCDLVCRAFEVCLNGYCMVECPVGEVACAGECADLATDLDHCGGCGRVCGPGEHALEAQCELGVCSVVCEAGWTDEDGDGSCETPCIVTSDTEICNGLDDNCDGHVDEGFDCRMGFEVGCTTACGSTGTGLCGIDCSPPEPGSCHPPSEVCNEMDDDCDGAADEDFDCVRGNTEAGDACDLSGHLERVCSDSCAWGEWVCIGGGGDCVPGNTRDCGDCGTQTCGTDGTWGSCAGEGECSPGATQGCGNCGTRTCSSSCSWGGCTDEGVCSPGATRGCGDCGTQTCTSSCSWGNCTGEGVCSPGSTQACGDCGTRTCTSSCSWGTCTGEGCSPGSTQPCGVCGTQTCNASCDWDACSGAGVSEDCRDCGAMSCLADGSGWGPCRRAYPEYCEPDGICRADGWCDWFPVP